MKDRTQRRPSGSTAMRVNEPLSAWTKANGRLPLHCRHSSPMTPPWTTAATVAPGPSAVEDAIQAGARALLEPLGRLGAGDDVPALLGEDLGDERIAARDGDPEGPAVELAEVDLAQLGQHDRLQARPLGERRGGLRGAAQRRHVERVQRLGRERRGDRLRLAHAGLRQRRIGLALEQLEGLVLARRLRRPVAHEHDLDRALRPRVVGLLVALGSHRPQASRV